MDTSSIPMDDKSSAVIERPEQKPTDVESAPPVPPPGSARLVSLDAFRGFMMLLMASEELGIPKVAKNYPDSPIWQFLAYQFSHVQWIGCGLWDLIQPSFTFMVGVAMPFSLAKRQAEGQSYGQMFRHALIRAFALIALGIFLRSDGKLKTNFTFEDTLTQIGLGYTFLFLLWNRPAKVQWAAVSGILFVYWLAFVLYPVPGPNFDYTSVGVKPDWQHLSGLAAHFDKNTNISAAADHWFLSLFPREKPFEYNGGGYLTLSFIPTLGTMIFGLLAGGLMKSSKTPEQKLRTLVIAGIAGLVIGQFFGLTGICPIVKRIWTPSWTIFSAGWACLLLAAFYWTIDLKGLKRWAFPLVVVGMNSIFMYVFSHLERGWIEQTLKTHFGQNVFEVFGTTFAPMVQQILVLFVLWLACLWMYRRKVFLKI